MVDLTISLTRSWYCGIWLACKMSDGFVVASVGLYCAIATKKRQFCVLYICTLDSSKPQIMGIRIVKYMVTGFDYRHIFFNFVDFLLIFQKGCTWFFRVIYPSCTVRTFFLILFLSSSLTGSLIPTQSLWWINQRWRGGEF